MDDFGIYAHYCVLRSRIEKSGTSIVGVSDDSGILHVLSVGSNYQKEYGMPEQSKHKYPNKVHEAVFRLLENLQSAHALNKLESPNPTKQGTDFHTIEVTVDAKLVLGGRDFWMDNLRIKVDGEHLDI